MTGQCDIRRLLISGASTVVNGGCPQEVAARLVARLDDLTKKPSMVVVVALANKMARTVWAVTVRETTCSAPAAA
jgi:transposase